MFSPYKNSYLQSTTSGINPRVINRCVQRAREYVCIDEHDLNPPFNRLTSEQPEAPLENLDPTRRPIGFGRWAMPKLRRELHSYDAEVVLAAVTSICELMNDPVRGYEAISLKIPDRMAELLESETPELRERTCLALTIIAGLADGRENIVANKYLLNNIAQCVGDEENYVRLRAARLLETIATFWKAADELVEFGIVELLLRHILSDDEPIVAIHLETLNSLMYCDGKKIALNEDFKKFVQLLDSDNEKIVSGACKCLSNLCSTKKGKIMALEMNLLQTLNKLIHDEREEVHTNAASVIMHCTIMTKAKIVASTIRGLAKRLIDLAKSELNCSRQIYAIKALTNICEHPAVRKEVKEKYFRNLENIQIGRDENIKDYKKILMRIVGWGASDAT